MNVQLFVQPQRISDDRWEAVRNQIWQCLPEVTVPATLTDLFSIYPDRDIFWVPPDDKIYPLINGVPLYSSTGIGPGNDNLLAHIAAGMIIERELPQDSFLTGPINSYLVRAAQGAVNERHDVELPVPLCSDAERLLARVQDPHRFRILFVGDDIHFYGALMQSAGDDRILTDMLTTELSEYVSLRQLRPRQIIAGYLHAGGSVTLLSETVELLSGHNPAGFSHTLLKELLETEQL